MELYELLQKQSLPLESKIILTLERIREFYEFMGGKVYIAFSGGKDSTVLLHLVRSIYPDVPAVFVNTGLEYPEIVEFVKTIDNVITLRPGMNFKKVLDTYGYPVASKRISKMVYEIRNGKNNEKTKEKYLSGDFGHSLTLSKKWRFLIDADFKVSDKCCNVMKKKPFKAYEKDTGNKAFIGTMASDSEGRTSNYLKRGCNTFEGTINSTPMGFWLEVDIWKYLSKYDLSYSEIYDMGEKRTGCMFCMFGTHMEGNPNKFQRMAKTHPKQYEYCMVKLGLKDILEQCGIDYKPIRTLDSFVND